MAKFYTVRIVPDTCVVIADSPEDAKKRAPLTLRRELDAGELGFEVVRVGPESLAGEP